jgi:hypothetical protein
MQSDSATIVKALAPLSAVRLAIQQLTDLADSLLYNIPAFRNRTALGDCKMLVLKLALQGWFP